MDRKYWTLTALVLIVTGCNNSREPQVSSGRAGADNHGTPDQVVSEFLEAVRTANHKHTAEMLTPLAREEAAKNDLVVAPRGSASAKFKVGPVKYITAEKDAAHVWTSWTDVVDQQGTTRTDEFVWVLRKEPEGWRIAGTYTKVLPDQPPLILNFEDAADMVRKLSLLDSGGDPSEPAGPVQPQATRSDSNPPATR